MLFFNRRVSVAGSGVRCSRRRGRRVRRRKKQGPDDEKSVEASYPLHLELLPCERAREESGGQPFLLSVGRCCCRSPLLPFPPSLRERRSAVPSLRFRHENEMRRGLAGRRYTVRKRLLARKRSRGRHGKAKECSPEAVTEEVFFSPSSSLHLSFTCFLWPCRRPDDDGDATLLHHRSRFAPFSRVRLRVLFPLSFLFRRRPIDLTGSMDA